MIIDNESEPGAWEREMGMRPQYPIQRCGMRAVCERQAARVAELTQALEPFAKIEVPPKASDGLFVAITQYCNMMVTAFMVRRARAALAKEGE